MAYQNVGTPRFYVDQIQYLKSVGFNFSEWYSDKGYNSNPASEDSFAMYDYPDLFTLEPGIQKTISMDKELGSIAFDFPTGYGLNPNLTGDNIGRYIAVLNHNIATQQEGLWIYTNWQRYIAGYSGYGVQEDGILNSEYELTPFDGSTIIEFNKTAQNFNPPNNVTKFARIAVAGYDSNSDLKEINIGALSWGVYYDMPHSPELDVTMTIENDGYDSITTAGGAHLNNIRYDGAPMWERVDGTQVPPWTVGEPTTIGRRRGRRVWSMNFKYLSEIDLFASNYMSNDYTENSDGYDSTDLHQVDGNDTFYYNLDDDDSFHAQVLNKIGNGQRFIFQPDNTNNNPDQFAICQLDQDSLEIKQVANSVYDISLKIKEVW